MTDPRPAPYPADTRAKGWRFELNMEQVKKSDTWLRARTGYVRAHLLLLWGEAWEQTPCGSLPNDDELLALLLDMDPDEFAKHRAVLMRGWWPAEDGRLYHDTVTERVLSMLEKRAKDSARAARNRAKPVDSDADRACVTRDTQVTSASSAREFDTKHQAPDTSKPPPKSPRRKRQGDGFDPKTIELPGWIDRELWKRWCADRAKRRHPITEEGAKGQIARLGKLRDDGIPPAAVLQHAMASGHQGLYAPPRDMVEQVVEDAAEWHDSVAGIRAKGMELGLGDWTEAEWAAGRAPDYLTYRARVFKAAGHSPRAAA